MMFLIRLLKRLIMLAILLAISFCGAYYFSGGTIFFEPATALRINRIVFLEREVNNSLDRDNYVTIDEMPESLTQAVVAVEDNRFYTHHGFDPEGIGRAALVNLQYGEVKEGASTITQQLVKNMFLSQDQTYGRKAEEVLLALDMELHYSKEQILEMYLNTIYFGSGFYGLKDACKGYFDKTPWTSLRCLRPPCWLVFPTHLLFIPLMKTLSWPSNASLLFSMPWCGQDTLEKALPRMPK